MFIISLRVTISLTMFDEIIRNSKNYLLIIVYTLKEKNEHLRGY